jgi:hypothetical protein
MAPGDAASRPLKVAPSASHPSSRSRPLRVATSVMMSMSQGFPTVCGTGMALSGVNCVLDQMRLML